MAVGATLRCVTIVGKMHSYCHSEPPEAAKNLGQNGRFFASLRRTHDVGRLSLSPQLTTKEGKQKR